MFSGIDEIIDIPNNLSVLGLGQLVKKIVVSLRAYLLLEIKVVEKLSVRVKK